MLLGTSGGSTAIRTSRLERGLFVARFVRTPSRGAVRGAPAPVLAPELVFDVATVAVMPVYGAMMFAPESKLARVVSSEAILLLGAVVYATHLVAYGGLELLRPFLEITSARSGLSTLSGLMENGRACSITWLHLLLVDLFQARFVFQDCVVRGLPSLLRIASLGLCFMVAPVGLLFHVTATSVLFFIRLKRK